MASFDEEQLEISFDGGKHYRPVEPLSRPGRINYPGGDAKEAKDADEWLRARSAAETNASQLWRVHDRLYDLKPFLPLHPGGAEWIERLRGCDATEAFEAHHLDHAKAVKALEKYYVRHVSPGEFAAGDRFVWDDEGFWRTLKQRVLDRLLQECASEGRDEAVEVARGAEAAAATATATAGRASTSTMAATGPTREMQAACAAVVGQWMAAFAATCAGGSSVAAALSGFFQVGCWGVGHNFMHQSDRKAKLWRYAMDLNPGVSSSQFRVTHALSHHMVPNLENDWEAGHYVGDGRFGYKAPTNNTRWLYAAAGLLGPVAGTVINTVRALRQLAGAAQLRWAEVLPSALPWAQLLALRAARGSWGQALKLWFIQGAVYNLWFMPWGLGVHHAAKTDQEIAAADAAAAGGGAGNGAGSAARRRDTHAWHEGQPDPASDFGAHQVQATTDHTIMPDWLPAVLAHYVSLTCFGYLNDHTLHHLFPAVDHSRHRLIRDVFLETCRDFGVAYRVADAKDVAMGFHRYMQNRSPRPRARL